MATSFLPQCILAQEDRKLSEGYLQEHKTDNIMKSLSVYSEEVLNYFIEFGDNIIIGT